MSVNPHGRGKGTGTSPQERASYDSKLKGIMVPHPVISAQPVNQVNRFQVLGQIPKPYNTVVTSKPPTFDPFANTSKPITNTKPIVPFDICGKPENVTEYVQRTEYNLFFIEHFMKPINNPVKLAAQYFPPG